MIVFKKITVNNYRLAALLSNFTTIKYVKASIDEQKNKIIHNLIKNKILQIDNTKKNNRYDQSTNFNDKNKIIDSCLKKFTKRKVFVKISNLIDRKFSERSILKMHLYEKIVNSYISGYAELNYWASNILNEDKIYYLSFDIEDVILPKINKVTKVIIPIDITILFNFFYKRFTFKNQKKNSLGKKIKSESKVGFLVHKSLRYGNLYNKDYFYSNQKKSLLHKSKIIHIFYSTKFLEREFKNSIILRSENSLKFFFKYFIKNIFYIRNLTDIYMIYFYIKFIIDCESYLNTLKEYQLLKLFIIDNEVQAPKPFLLALRKLRIKIIALEERAVTKYNFPCSFLGDVYFTSSKYFYKKKFFKVKKNIPVGYPRTDQVAQSKAGASFVLIFGSLGDENYYNQKNEILINWEEQSFFINQIIKLSNIYKNEKFVLRYKNTDWLKNKYFLDLRKKILQVKNLTINADSYSTYRLVEKSKLVISSYSTIVEETIFIKKPVLVLDYNKNLSYIFKKSIRNGSIPFIFCNSYNELVKKFDKILYNKKFRIKLLSNLQNFMKYPKNNLKSKKIIQEHLENLLKAKY